MIESYSFGKISIEGNTYTSDLIIYPDRIKENWVRKKGHKLLKEDIEQIVKEKPDVLIIGKGAYGVMKIPEDTLDYVESKGIEMIAEKTKKATQIYNKLKDGKKRIIGAFHLTC